MHERTTISISFGSISMIDFRPLPGTDHTTSVEDHTLDSSARAPRLFARSPTLSQHFRSRTDRLNWDYDSGVRGGDEESLRMVLLLCSRFFEIDCKSWPEFRGATSMFQEQNPRFVRG